MAQQIFKGIGSGSGFAIAPAVIVHRGELAIPHIELPSIKILSEVLRFHNALKKTREQLQLIRSSIAKAMGEDAAVVIEAQLLVLGDPGCIEETERLIKSRKINAEYAFDTVINGTIEALLASDDKVFQERAHDFHDIRRRLLVNLMGLKQQVLSNPDHEAILVIDNLAPSETAHLFGSNFVGLITETGSFTSHISIMSRTMDLPAVLGIEGITELVPDNAEIIADSMLGQAVIEPEKEVIEEYSSKKKIYERRRAFVMKSVDKPAITPDNTKVVVAANMELPEEVYLAEHFGAAGIGLFRTELLFIQREDLPSEDEQFEVYKKIAKQITPHSAIIRTFDIGGDKLGTLFEHHFERNPFLGFRAIRIGLVYPEILKTQLRAILRASAFGNLKIIFPMISLVEEMTMAREIVEEIKKELTDKRIPFDSSIQVGAMIEVPSAAILSRELAHLCDFFSIGTNDLIQYTLAADRGNAHVAHIYQTFQPAVLKLIKFTIDSAHLAGIWVGVCGEIAGEVMAVPLLLGMDLDEFSTVPARVPIVKTIIRAIPKQKARQIAEQVIRFSTQDEVISFLNKELANLLPPEFIEGNDL